MPGNAQATARWMASTARSLLVGAIILLVAPLVAAQGAVRTYSANMLLSQPDMDEEFAPAFEAIFDANRRAKRGPLAKFGPGLLREHFREKAWRERASRPGARIGDTFRPRDRFQRLSQDRVVIDLLVANPTPALLRRLQRRGLKDPVAYGNVVSGSIAYRDLPRLANVAEVQHVGAARASASIGIVTSQGDVAMNSDDLRGALTLDGAGVKVGTLSDSFDCLGGAASNVATLDLPSGINVLADFFGPTCIDEGRAMMQLIADVAPGAPQSFHTAFLGTADFAQGIIDLANDGAQVIVDDIIYFTEPMFQDGPIAQAVDTVRAGGAVYFSSAGNSADASYESTFNDSGTNFVVNFGPFSINFGEMHDFDIGPGEDLLQGITVPVGSTLSVSLQWNQPYFSVSGGLGSNGDLDAFLIGADGTSVLQLATDSNLGGDPVEILQFSNDGSFDLDGTPGADTSFSLVITTFPGAATPTLIKYVGFGAGTGFISEFDTNSPTSYGHANAAGAVAVGAAFYQQTPPFGTSPPLVESFSAKGGVPILFDTSGADVNELRPKPEIVAPDGTDTTFFGVDVDGNSFPNFFGTSAAAPHAAAVAALAIESAPGEAPAAIVEAMVETAEDMSTTGFDDRTGRGFIDAERIVAYLADEVLGERISFAANAAGQPLDEGAGTVLPAATYSADGVSFVFNGSSGPDLTLGGPIDTALNVGTEFEGLYAAAPADVGLPTKVRIDINGAYQAASFDFAAGAQGVTVRELNSTGTELQSVTQPPGAGIQTPDFGTLFEGTAPEIGNAGGLFQLEVETVDVGVPLLIDNLLLFDTFSSPVPVVESVSALPPVLLGLLFAGLGVLGGRQARLA